MKQLWATLLRLAQLQGDAVDRLALQELVEKAGVKPKLAPEQCLAIVTHGLQVAKATVLTYVDETHTPALLFDEVLTEWGILRGKDAQGAWISEWFDEKIGMGAWVERKIDADMERIQAFRLRLAKPYTASNSPVFQVIKHEIFAFRKPLVEALFGGVTINLVGLATSFYSMQVYDRVIPTGAAQTLLVLTAAVLFAVLFELLAKHIRSGLYDRVVEEVDKRLSRKVFSRFLALRLDQIPRSVGSLSSQLRGYETVRGFLTTATTTLMVDAPFAILFVGIIAMIGGVIALVPLVFFLASLMLGLYYRREVESLAIKSNAASNFKTGLLVETVEGAETIKSGQGGWRMLSKWMNVSDHARQYELRMRELTENSQHFTGTFQQISYIFLVAFGAAMVVSGQMTMGGLIACSILSGRVLTPVAAMPGLLIQWANTKAALKSLDAIWMLQDDYAGVEQPLVPAKLAGNYSISNVQVNYADRVALILPHLEIKAGEKVGVLGHVGAGKTTLLRLLSGMYKPQQGRVLLDGMDIDHISKPVLAHASGYLQQEGRLFAGTLRENLILGLIDPGDEVILVAAKKSGLHEAVLLQHPKGLQQEIYEGGSGLSGGQRQLVNLTRVLLRQPHIWLLDEPTSSMDRKHELNVMNTLRAEIKAEDTLILITHKPEMMQLVDRIIVIVNHQVVMDGPRDQVLQKLQADVSAQNQKVALA